MTRLLLSTGLVLCIGLGTALAEDAPKKCPEKPAVEKKQKAERAPRTAEQKAEMAKKRAEAVEKMFQARDKDGDGKLTLDELKGKSDKPEAAARAEKLLAAKDKDGDGAVSKAEMTARPQRQRGRNKPAGKKHREKK